MSVGRPKLWAVGSGRVGVGRRLLAASMAAVLARMGRAVVVVEADPGSSGLHGLLGIAENGRAVPDRPGGDSGRARVLLQTQLPNLRLLIWAADAASARDCRAAAEPLRDFVSRLDADLVIADVGTGATAAALDLFSFADQGIVVVSPEPDAIDGACDFIGRALQRRVQASVGDDFPPQAVNAGAPAGTFSPAVLVNMAPADDGQQAFEALRSRARRFPAVQVRFVGAVGCDTSLRQAARNPAMAELLEGSGPTVGQLRRAVLRLVAHSALEPATGIPQPAKPVTGLNDNVMFLGKELHVQTEDLGRCVTTQVFLKGRVIHSRRAEYPVGAAGRSDRAQVAESMRRQHFEVIRELESRREATLPTS